jgi:aminopeptidase
MTDPRDTRLARVLVDYALEVRPEQKVSITGQTSALPLLEAVYERVLECGAFPHLLVSPPGLEALFLRRANEAQLAYVSPISRLIVEEMDATVSVDGSANTREMSGVDPVRQARRRQALAPLHETLFRRTAEGRFNWVTTLYPAPGNAQDAEMSLREFEDFVYGACHVTGDDDPVEHWRRVHSEQQRLIEWLRPHDRVEVRGPHVDLRLSVKGRTFLNADGKRNMPDGEIFTGPVEDSAEGWVRFSYPVVEFGREIEGVELKFEAGRVTQAAARKNEEFLLSALDTDEGSRYLGEFAIGTNDDIKRFSKNILFDEKIGGSFHLAVGAGFPETGSRNRSGLHWDMICDLREGGEIAVDGETVYRNGRFLI